MKPATTERTHVPERCNRPAQFIAANGYRLCYNCQSIDMLPDMRDAWPEQIGPCDWPIDGLGAAPMTPHWRRSNSPRLLAENARLRAALERIAREVSVQGLTELEQDIDRIADWLDCKSIAREALEGTKGVGK